MLLPFAYMHALMVFQDYWTLLIEEYRASTVRLLDIKDLGPHRFEIVGNAGRVACRGVDGIQAIRDPCMESGWALSRSLIFSLPEP